MNHLFAKFASATARAAGSPYTFIISLLAIIGWAFAGPVFGYSENWQLVVNTATTIITFLMVFLIQNSQNRDGEAIQTKLDELIRSSDARDEFMGIEKLSDKELVELHQRCEREAKRVRGIVERAAAERERRSATR